jgi:hypothetical protein
MKVWLVASMLVLAPIVTAYGAELGTPERVINEFPAGFISKEDGLKHWQKFFEVASHPRCVNCHVGPNNTPMWSGKSYGKTRPHGMSVTAGRSRIGAETVLCSACHTQLKRSNVKANAMPHTPPKVVAIWRLEPVSAEWFGKISRHICEQIKDPERNGKRSIRDVAAHFEHDKVLRWAWSPGGHREPAPRTLQETMDDLMKWAAAGAPCPKE